MILMRFKDFFDPHDIAVIAVAQRAIRIAAAVHAAVADRDVESQLRIDRIRFVLANVPFHARAAQIGSNQAPINRLFSRGQIPTLQRRSLKIVLLVISSLNSTMRGQR